MNVATGVAYVDGRTDGRESGGRRGHRRRRVRTTCADRLRAKGQHGAWLTAGGQATIERSEIVACKINKCISHQQLADDCNYQLIVVPWKTRAPCALCSLNVSHQS